MVYKKDTTLGQTKEPTTRRVFAAFSQGAGSRMQVCYGVLEFAMNALGWCLVRRSVVGLMILDLVLALAWELFKGRSPLSERVTARVEPTSSSRPLLVAMPGGRFVASFAPFVAMPFAPFVAFLLLVRPGAPSSFLLLLVRHLLLEAMPFAPFVAFLLLVRPGAPSSFLLLLVRHLLLEAMPFAPFVAFLLLVVRPGAPSSFLLLLVRHLLLEAMHLFLVAFLLLVVRPGAPRLNGFGFRAVAICSSPTQVTPKWGQQLTGNLSCPMSFWNLPHTNHESFQDGLAVSSYSLM